MNLKKNEVVGFLKNLVLLGGTTKIASENMPHY